MTKAEANEILGDRPTWELRNMKKALSFMALLTTEEENKRLEAVCCLLRNRKKV